MRTVWQRLAALCLAALLVVSCSTAVDETPGAGISSRAPTDYQAIETAIETKIMSGSVGWQTIEAVLVSVDGTDQDRALPQRPEARRGPARLVGD